MKPRILIAGIGNIFKGDDGFGVEVIHELLLKSWEDHVRIIDFGIRGLDLAYELLDGGYDRVLLVDAVQRGDAPGTLSLIDPELDEVQEVPEAHGMHPSRVLNWVKAMGGQLNEVQILGCEPERVGTDEELLMGLSEPVKAAVPDAVRAIEELLVEFRKQLPGETPCTS